MRKLLVRLTPLEALQGFALGGGTSLALRFGHRWSVDLDFFTTAEFSPEELFEKLAISPATVTARSANTLTVDAGGVKLDLLRHAYKTLAPPERIDGITVVSLPDLAAMKLNAIANRGSKKDFYDFAELLEHFSIQQMIGFFIGKYPATDPFTVIRSLAWFEDAEHEPDPVSLNGRSWENVVDRARNAVAGLS
ncbi:MAG: nucleotidyl transferase AbiEii/AbiGii toxin family protein [Verrucomicrobiota bacterium]